MRYLTNSLLIVLFLLIKQSYAITVQDDLGRSISLQQPASRVISLAPSITETLFAIGAGKQVIGVSDDTDYPAAAKELPNIGGYQAINIEKIISLKPDLVVAWAQSGDLSQLQSLQRFHIPVYVVNNLNLPDVAHTMQNLGLLTGNVKSTAVAMAIYQDQYHNLQVQYQNKKPKVKVFVQLSNQPLFTLNNQSLIGQIVQLCGGSNIFGNLLNYADIVSNESVIKANPDLLIILTPGDGHFWQSWNGLKANQYNGYLYVDGDLLARDGPRLLDGAALVCRAIDRVRKQIYLN